MKMMNSSAISVKRRAGIRTLFMMNVNRRSHVFLTFLKFLLLPGALPPKRTFWPLSRVCLPSQTLNRWATETAPKQDAALFLLAKIRPDHFDPLYKHGHLTDSTEGRFWLAANTIVGSRWLMNPPPPVQVPNSGPPAFCSKRVAFQYVDATVPSNSSGISLQQKGTCSGNY